MAQAIRDKAAEPAFLRALLDATVYAHAPVVDDNPKLRLIQFARPDGLMVIPFFSDLAKAQRAAGTAARIVKLSGRQLMEGCPGAALMLNPNDTSCTLYPEEIRALLTGGHIATVDQVQLDDQQAVATPPSVVPTWLVSQLMDVFAKLPTVETAYLADLHYSEHPDQRTLVVAVCVPKADAERVARAVLTAVQERCTAEDLPLDLTPFEPAQGLPEWLARAAVDPFYVRAWAKAMADAATKTAQ